VCACTSKKYIKNSLDELEFGILFDVMTRFMYFSILFALVGRILSHLLLIMSKQTQSLLNSDY